MFTEQFEKLAGETSEVVGTVMGFPAGAIVGGGLGLMKGKYSKEQQKEADKKSWSNVLLPPLGAYRMARRRGHGDK
jgi:hypothetical protein